MNVVAQAARPVLEGTTVIVTSLHPCPICAGMLDPDRRCPSPSPSHRGGEKDRKGREDWDEKGAIAMQMLAEAGVEVVYYDEESLNEYEHGSKPQTCRRHPQYNGD